MAISDNPQYRRYLIDKNKHPNISIEEQIRLGEEIQKTKSREAINKLILANLGLVIPIAIKIGQNQKKDLSSILLDLIQEGNIGLEEAAQRFDPKKAVEGTGFVPYAVSCIRGRILANLWKVDEMRSNYRNLKGKIWKIKDDYKKEHGFYPSSEEIAELLNKNEGMKYSGSDIKDLLMYYRRKDKISLNKPLGRDEDLYLIDRLTGDGQRNLENLSKNLSLKKFLSPFLDRLADEYPSEFNVLKLFFLENQQLPEIAKSFGIRQEMARQKINLGLRRMKKYIKEKHGYDFDFSRYFL
jgi:RNA polymerase primary sigma factor